MREAGRALPWHFVRSWLQRSACGRSFEGSHACMSHVQVEASAIEDIIRPLGLHRKRARDIQRMSREYMYAPWMSAGQLHG